MADQPTDRGKWMRVTMEVPFTFSGTHHLSFGGKEARQQHRHVWAGCLSFRAEINPGKSHCVDFKEVQKEILNSGPIPFLEGKNLNDVFRDPTLEVVAAYVLMNAPGYVENIHMQAGSSRVSIRRRDIVTSWVLGHLK